MHFGISLSLVMQCECIMPNLSQMLNQSSENELGVLLPQTTVQSPAFEVVLAVSWKAHHIDCYFQTLRMFLDSLSYSSSIGKSLSPFPTCFILTPGM